MKTIKNLFAILFIATMMVPQVSLSQTMNKRASSNSTEEQIWKPINKFKDYQNLMQTSPDDPGKPVLTNTLDGVSFYSMKSNCNSEEVLLLKLINSNTYPVKVSWKMSPNTPEVVVPIMALSTQVGSCSNSNADLIIKIPIDVDRKDVFKYAIAHLHIIKIEE